MFRQKLKNKSMIHRFKISNKRMNHGRVGHGITEETMISQKSCNKLTVNSYFIYWAVALFYIFHRGRQQTWLDHLIERNEKNSMENSVPHKDWLNTLRIIWIIESGTECTHTSTAMIFVFCQVLTKCIPVDLIETRVMVMVYVCVCEAIPRKLQDRM